MNEIYVIGIIQFVYQYKRLKNVKMKNLTQYQLKKKCVYQYHDLVRLEVHSYEIKLCKYLDSIYNNLIE